MKKGAVRFVCVLVLLLIFGIPQGVESVEAPLEGRGLDVLRQLQYYINILSTPVPSM